MPFTDEVVEVLEQLRVLGDTVLRAGGLIAAT